MKFTLDNFIDSTGKTVSLNFTQSEITIIDFWFNDCLPCLKEMKQFKRLINGKNKEISIISISVNNYIEWKKTLKSSSKRFSFFLAPVSNWHHLVMNSEEDLKFNNEIPGDNIKILSDRFQSQRFPMYFVLDTTGTIIETPFSAVDFITNKFSKQNKVSQFLKDNRTWTLLYSIILQAFIEYSGYYWILVVIILGLMQFNSNRRTLKNNSENSKPIT